MSINIHTNFLNSSYLNGKIQNNLLGTLEEFLKIDSLPDYLQMLANDKLTALSMPTKSYEHPNGYSKLVLNSPIDFPVPYELRLHHWTVQLSRIEADIHNHDWNFASHVLFGQIQFEEFEESNDGFSIPRYQYVRDSQDQFTISQEKPTTLRTVQSGKICTGQTYSLTRGMLHRVTADVTLETCTIILQGTTLTSKTDIFSHHPKLAPRTFRIKPMKPCDYRDKLLYIASKL